MSEKKSVILNLFKKKLRDLPPLDLISFDIFDTLITRAIATPSSLFILLGEQLFKDGLIQNYPEEFARARLLAEQRARCTVSPPADVSLKQIYLELSHGWPALYSHLSQLMIAELELENRMIRLIPYSADLISLAREKSRKIAFVSDMYLPEEFIKKQLAKHDLIQPDDFIYVSSARGFTKCFEGSLLKHVLREHMLDAKNTLHIGDNWFADYQSARSIGMHAFLLPNANPNRYEKLLESYRWESGGQTSVLAGASRCARLQYYKENTSEVLISVLAGIAGPLLVGFTFWLLRRAKESGIRRLYFLSREGELLFELANIIDKQMQLDLDLRYLYVSRQSVNLALLTEPSLMNLSWALTHSEEHQLQALLKRLGLKPEVIRSELSEIGLTENKWSCVMSTEDHNRLINLLCSGEAREKLIGNATKARFLVEKYLEQEGFFDDLPVGIVDTTGVGSQLKTLNLLRLPKTEALTEGFLIIRDWQRDLREESGFPSIQTYLADRKNKRGYYRVPGLIQLLEIFTKTDYGTVLGYQEKNGKIMPVLDNKVVDRSSVWTSSNLRKAIFFFAEEISLQEDFFFTEKDARCGIVEALSLFWNQPTFEEAKFWGGFPFEMGSGEDKYNVVLAPSLNLFDLYNIYRGKLPASLYWPAWQAGSVQLSPWHIRTLIKTYKLLKRVFHKAQFFSRTLSYKKSNF